jgi:hypothetical protein
LERLSAPEELNDYLHITGPAVWAVLIAVFLVLAGLFGWAHFTSVQSYAFGSASAKNGVLTISFPDREMANLVNVGMKATVGELQAEIESVGTDENGRKIAVAQADVPDGTYEVKVGYKSTEILGFVFDNNS